MKCLGTLNIFKEIQDLVTQFHVTIRYKGRVISRTDPGHGPMKSIKWKSEPLPLNLILPKSCLSAPYFLHEFFQC